MGLYQGDKPLSSIGKSPAAYAKDAGYTGTNDNFYAALANMPDHLSNQENPHGTTASQVGADVAGAANEALNSAKAYTDQIVAGVIPGDGSKESPADSDSIFIYDNADSGKPKKTLISKLVELFNNTFYTKTESDTLLQKKVNPNLLDNWYFGNPVDQRGQTSYSANGYTIDRWRTDHNISYGTLTVDKTTGCVTLSHADDGGFVDFGQYLENPPTEIVTLSVLMLNGNLYSSTGTLGNISLYTDEIHILSTSPSNVVLRCNPGKTISMKAAKLELGSTQTLAHQDENGNWVLNEIPDYGEQLRRCQRYFVNFNPYKMPWFAMPPAVASNNIHAYSAVTLPVAMRAQPVVAYGGNIMLSQEANHAVTSISVSDSTFTGNSIQLKYEVETGSLTANSLYRVQGGYDASAYIWLSADL